MKRTIKKLNLRRETISELDLAQANGGSPVLQLNTQVQSACQLCYPIYRPTERLTWPIQFETSQHVAGPGY